MSRAHYRPAELRRDRARPRNAPAPCAAAVERRLAELISLATFALVDEYRRLGLRERVLTLPVMVSLLLALIWRQVPSIATLARLVNREGALWTPPTRVSQQALNVRLRTLPPGLFQELLHRVLPGLRARAAARARPRPPAVERALAHFAHLWAADATTLEALFKKVGLLEGVPGTVLAGKLLGVLDVATGLPVRLCYDEDADVNERSLLDRLRAMLPAGALLLLDKGFFGFALFDWPSRRARCFIIPDRQTTAYTVVAALRAPAGVRDEVVRLGAYRSNPCRHPVRRIELTAAGARYAYLTNVLDPAVLSAADVAALYRLRWRIEEAFALVKRLLGLAYLWTGAPSGIQLQVWSTWLLYAVLVDLADDVAERLGLPLARISLEMVSRGLSFFAGAYQRGEARDPAAYLAAQRDLGVVKRPRPPSALDIALAAIT